MTLIHSIQARARSLPSSWFTAATALAMGLSSLGFVFWPEIASAIEVWIGSKTFNHCFLIIPVAAYLAWQRRAAIFATSPEPMPWIALTALPVVVCWLLAERIGVMEGRQLLAMTLVQILFFAVLGWRSWIALSAPLLYLFFLVPFGEYLVTPLQAFTVRFITAGLNVLGIVNFTDGTTIQI